ncbi:MAG: YwiC-like family protein [Chloroflexi bacterium]|nr:YwiC-like family protein [Chloroflexota bacterium]
MSRCLLIPREHGAWAMLLVPFVVGSGVSGRIGWETILFLLTILFVFLARYPLTLLVKRNSGEQREPILWLLSYGALGTVSSTPLLLYYGRWGLIPLGGLGLILLLTQVYLGSYHLERTAWGELLGIAGLSLTAPGAYYTTSGQLDNIALWLWLLCFLYSGSSVFYVKMLVRRRIRRMSAMGDEGWSLARDMAIYQSVLILALSGLVLAAYIPLLVPLAFLPLAFKVLTAIFSSQMETSIKRIGFIELAHALLFCVLLILTYRLPQRMI